MSIFEFNQELHDKTLFEDGVAAGMEKGEEAGIELGIHICRKIQSWDTDNSRIAEFCGCMPGKVKEVRKQFGL